MDRSRRPDPEEYNPYYERYVGQVPDGDVVATLRAQFEETLALLRAVPEGRGDHAYADGKWSIKEVVGHMADTERVMAYRALVFARGDRAELPSFEQDEWMPESHFAERTLESLVAELAAVRQATLALLGGLPAVAWTRSGIASGRPVSVRALAWIIAGHERHHAGILRERYLAPEASASA